MDNISDTALLAFREAAQDLAITKDDIFDYTYGVLHAPDYRERFANDLAKGLPRVALPTPGTWRAFADAGSALGALHLGYETCARRPLRVVAARDGMDLTPDHFRLATRKMRFADKKDRETLIVNEHVRLTGIPPEAHQYVVNGRTPLEWFIDRYHVKTDRRSGIVNDADGWFDDPRDLVAAIERIVHMSVETVRIVGASPNAVG